MVKLSVGLINEAQRRADVCRSGGITPPFLTSALDGGEWSLTKYVYISKSKECGKSIKSA
jgi:hypothetical protein